MHFSLATFSSALEQGDDAIIDGFTRRLDLDETPDLFREPKRRKKKSRQEIIDDDGE